MKRISIIAMVFVALAFNACKCEKKGDAAAADSDSTLLDKAGSKLDEFGNFIWDTGSEKEFELPDGTKIKAGDKSTEYVLFDRLSGDYEVSEEVKDGDWFTFTNVQFDKGTFNIAAASKTQLDNVIKVLKAYPESAVKIGGYTDAKTGTPEGNLELSQKRADAVVKYLADAGIAAERVGAEGFGGKYPLCEETEDATEECLAQNRRVDLRITKK